MKRGRKPTKFGKIVSITLSPEAIQKASTLSPNRSALVEALINKEWSIRESEENKKVFDSMGKNEIT